MVLQLPDATSYQVQHDVKMNDKYNPSNTQIVEQKPKKGFDEFGSFDEWYYDTFGYNPSSFGGKFVNFFGGDIDKYLNAYNQWYAEQDEIRKVKADMEASSLREQQQFTNFVKGAEAAGLNPYALLAGGGMSLGNMTYASSNNVEAASKKKTQGSNDKALIAGLALIISAIVKAAL